MKKEHMRYTICPHCGVIIKFHSKDTGHSQLKYCGRCGNNFAISEKNTRTSPPDDIFDFTTMISLILGGMCLGGVIQGCGGVTQAIWGFVLLSIALLTELCHSLIEAAIIRDLRRGR